MSLIWQLPHPEEHLAGLTPQPMEHPSTLGTHVGVASRRPMFYEDTVLPVEKLSLTGVLFDSDGVAHVQRHLSRFENSPSNSHMIERLQRIIAGELAPTDYDVRFYTHELREACRYGSRGWSDGVPGDGEAHRLWDIEHTCTLEDFGIHEKRFPLYHPECPDD